jgi:hypothetical protein
MSHIIPSMIFEYDASLKDLLVNDLISSNKSGIVIILVVILFINLFFQIS